MNNESIWAVIICLIGPPVYFLPSIIAFKRKLKYRWPIFVINLLLGWLYGVGYIISFVWVVWPDVAKDPLETNKNAGTDENIHSTATIKFSGLLKNLFVFEGKVCRSAYWKLIGICILLGWIFSALTFFNEIFSILYVVNLWILLATFIKRLRDSQNPLWYSIVCFIPLLAVILGCIPSKEELEVTEKEPKEIPPKIKVEPITLNELSQKVKSPEPKSIADKLMWGENGKPENEEFEHYKYPLIIFVGVIGLLIFSSFFKGCENNTKTSSTDVKLDPYAGFSTVVKSTEETQSPQKPPFDPTQPYTEVPSTTKKPPFDPDAYIAANTPKYSNKENGQRYLEIAIKLSEAGGSENFHKSIDYAKKSRECGNLGASFHLGLIFINELDDPWSSEKYYLEVSETMAEAAYNLGRIYLFDKRLKDEKKGANFIFSAAQKNFPEALNLMGVLYNNGIGVQRDLERGASYYIRGVELGNPTAMNNLGMCYITGQGVTKDAQKGTYWLQKAIDSGYQPSKRP